MADDRSPADPTPPNETRPDDPARPSRSALIADLRTLAALMPGGRIRIQGSRAYGVGPTEHLYVVHGGRLHHLCTLSPEAHQDIDASTLMLIEYTLREECRARHWEWASGEGVRPYASVMQGPHLPPRVAGTPAHAFVLAMIRALQTAALTPNSEVDAD